jgi:hypothetical protein
MSARETALKLQHLGQLRVFISRVRIALTRGSKVGYTTEAILSCWLDGMEALAKFIADGDEASVFSRLEKLSTDVKILESTVRDAELQYYFRNAGVPTAVVAGSGRRRERKYS